MSDAEDPETFPPCPDKRTDCAFSGGGMCTTLLGWTPVYDRAGKLLNADPNTITRTVSCHTCRRQWLTRTRGGKLIESRMSMHEAPAA